MHNSAITYFLLLHLSVLFVPHQHKDNTPLCLISFSYTLFLWVHVGNCKNINFLETQLLTVFFLPYYNNHVYQLYIMSLWM